MSEPEKADVPMGEAARVDLALHQVIRDAQAQHGYRHGDYARYRKYCAGRLLRLYKSLKFTHGKGTYQKRELMPEDVVEPRHLLIPLISAERAWGQAMEIKKEMSGAKKWHGHRRHHMVKRLRKASAWAEKAESLCAKRGSTRTALEAEAYAKFMKGSYVMELEKKWPVALQHLLLARTLYESLGRSGDASHQAVFRELLSELEPTILFCKYQIQKSQGKGEARDLERIKSAEVTPLLQAKLDSLAGGGAARLSEVEWRGRKVKVPSERLVGPVSHLCDLIAKCDEAKGEGALGGEELEKRLEAYGGVFAAWDDLKQVLQGDHADAASGGASAMSQQARDRKATLDIFESLLSGLMVEQRVKRNLELVESRWAAYVPQSGQQQAGPGGRRRQAAGSTSPGEMIRLYDMLKRDVADLAEVAESDPAGEDEQLYAECAVASRAVKSLLCFFLAEHYAGSGQDTHAYLLYNRAVEHADSAGAGGSGPLAGVSQGLAKGVALSRIGRCIAHGRACASAGEDGAAGQAGAGAVEGAPGAQTLLENMDKPLSFLDEGKGRVVIEVPAALTDVPCPPLMLDTAISHITYPAVAAPGSTAGDKSKPQSQSIMGLFGWGR